MKKRDIIGKNYRGHWDNTRTACRGIIIRDEQILLSYETKTGQWMLPGGGLEDGEDEQSCCIREVAEETGILIQPSECQMEIDEYYEGWKWVNRYFFGTVTGQTEIKLTDREKEVGMEPRWLPVGEIIGIFSRHASYADTDEMRCGMYLREYTALCELLSDKAGRREVMADGLYEIEFAYRKIMIRKVPSANKRNYLPLLLLADEQEDMIDRYLDRGEMYILTENDVVRGECVVTDEGDSILEIKNLAVSPERQGHGYGRILIKEMESRYHGHYKYLQVGTGDSPLTVPFYEHCGFVLHHRLRNFFPDNYDHPIFEARKQLIDMIILRKKI